MHRIGKEKRSKEIPDIFVTPGPGEYDWKMKEIGELGKFGKDQRFTLSKGQTENPGPGNYQIAGLMGTGKKWVMGSKIRPKMFTENTPGTIPVYKARSNIRISTRWEALCSRQRLLLFLSVLKGNLILDQRK